MGSVIRRGAAVEDIFDDVEKALHDGVAKGGAMKDIVEADLKPIFTIVDTVNAELKAAKAAAAPLLSAVKAENEKADDLLGRVYDETWNDVGRPAFDPALEILFPGGFGYYAEGSTEEQPTRMELLARLFEKGIHPKLAASQAQAKATVIREGATVLAAAVDAARLPATNVMLLERIRTALGRASHSALTKAKRSMKNAGFSEADIHSVIPDRSPPAPKKAEP